MRVKISGITAVLALVTGAMGSVAVAQYPGQVATTPKDQPILRAISVLEWTGDAGKPKTSRIVPVAVFDGQTLQDGGIYLARPQPLAVSNEVEYELRKNGKTVGLYDIHGAGQQQGAWVGFGAWKALPKPKPEAAAAKVDDSGMDDDNDRPTLHRKHHKGDDTKSGDTKNAPANAPVQDSDRPTLHKKDTDGNTPDSPDDTDRPTLHRKDSTSTADSSSTTGSAPNPDRPVLHKEKAQPAAEGRPADALATISDPDRPRLIRGKPENEEAVELPSLVGIPQEMHQMVAVSDSRNRPEHLWTFSWSNPTDELKMKAELEGIARVALGLAKPVEPAPKLKPARASKGHARTPKAVLTEPPPPAELTDEDFRVFELAYGSGATMVLTARTDVDFADQKFVTLVAQPDLYGNVRVLLKSVTDGRQLDVTPRMRLVDAVDALSDNRGELLFELRGRAQRQFALYRVYRGQIEKLFVTGGEWFGTDE